MELIGGVNDNIGDAVEDYLRENPIEVDLTGYATEKYVDDAIAVIELMPGPKGEQGEKGIDGYTPVKGVDYFDGKDGKDGKDGEQGPKGDKGDTGPQGIQGEQGPAGQDGIDGADYVLTEEDKAEIAGMVEVSGGDVDLSDYYTKEEVDNLLANLPTGDIPSGEEVKW